jgi:hypothetical protein
MKIGRSQATVRVDSRIFTTDQTIEDVVRALNWREIQPARVRNGYKEAVQDCTATCRESERD